MGGDVPADATATTPGARHRYEKRRRDHLVGVRFSDAEYMTLVYAMAKTGKTAPTLLREVFLMADNHQLLPSLVGPWEPAEPVCICVRFSDTGGFRVGDLTCPVHGVDGTEPLDGPWDDAEVSDGGR